MSITGIKKIFATILLTAAIAAATGPGSRTQIHRYLRSAGANDGGKDRVLLRYAVTDAQAFASVLTDMGGVGKNHAFILADPDSRGLLGGISDLGKLIAKNKAPNVRHEVFIYYSGHADADGLKLGSETLRWEDFRSAVNGLSAEVRVAVLDACGSGAITRTKGGVARPAFLSDASTNMKGYAFLTSSNENEASQESDRIKGSYFTHALLSGMRGAADMTGDGKVTINEAYQYAFNETLRSTQNTSAGAQHPSRDMNLAGTGDIVMTDLRETSAILSLDADTEGRFFIRDANGVLFAELNKLRGRKIELGMPPGKYSVQMEAPSRVWMANDIVITEGEKTLLSMNDMKVMKRRATVARGGENPDGADNGDVIDDGDVYYVDDDGMMPQDAAGSRDSGPAALSSANTSKAPPDSLAAAQSPDSSRNTPYATNINWLGLSVAYGQGKEVQYSPVAKGVWQVQAGIVNLADEIEVVQAGVVNIAKKVEQIQAGSINIAKEVGSVQGGNVNVAKNVGYVQAGNVNAAKNVGYVQAGNVNIAKNVGYVQGGNVNIAKNVGYIQAGDVNVADSVKYVQTGVVNIAARYAGYQFGVVNVANNTEHQIGVLNVAKYSEKTPIGLLSFVGNGICDITGYADAMGDQSVSFRTGTPWFYNLIEYSSAAYDENSRRRDDKDYRWLRVGYGVGTRFGMNGPLALNLDFVGQQIGDWDEFFSATNSKSQARFTGDPHFHYVSAYYKLRFGASYIPQPFIALTGGVSLNAIVDGDPGSIEYKPASGNLYREREFRDVKIRYWPGVYAGVTLGKVKASKREKPEAKEAN